jgi:hypothetical protein
MKRILITLCIAITWRAYGQTGRTVNLTWTASATSSVSYNAYRATGTCAAASGFAKINTAAIGTTSYSDTSMPATGTFCYYVTAAAGGLESVPSNKAEAIVPPAPATALSAVVPATAQVKVGQWQQFLAVDNTGQSVPNVTWSIAPVIGGIRSDGLYVAPASIQGNNVPVLVTATSGPVSATADITLRKK